VPEANSQKLDPIFTHAILKLYSLKARYIFHFVWEFASA